MLGWGASQPPLQEGHGGPAGYVKTARSAAAKAVVDQVFGRQAEGCACA